MPTMSSLMTFDELLNFLTTKMRMSHIYQPLLIRALVDAGGTATLRQLAHAFLAQDESQLQFYETRIKEMPLRILAKHGVVQHDGQLVSLAVPHLTYVQRAQLKMACEQRMQEYVQKRNLALWDYRLLDTDPVPDDLRFQALKASGGRCALCGTTKDDSPLDVDHILPRSLGGKTERANLQALCAKCNRTKGNKDTTDFRPGPTPEVVPSCPFCSTDTQDRAVEQHGSALAVLDAYPVTPGHHLVLPRRHATEYFTMTRQDAEDLLRVLRNRLAEADSSIQGFNVGINCGEVAGQTVMHAHIHLIPRRKGDMVNPRGGVRGVIPERMGY
jgi:ATP adenylyltransferase